MNEKNSKVIVKFKQNNEYVLNLFTVGTGELFTTKDMNKAFKYSDLDEAKESVKFIFEKVVVGAKLKNDFFENEFEYIELGDEQKDLVIE